MEDQITLARDLADCVGSENRIVEFLTHFPLEQFTELHNDRKIEVMRKLWSSSDLPMRQLDRLGITLSKLNIEGEHIYDVMLYRAIRTDKPMKEEVSHNSSTCPFTQGSWTDELSIAEFFVEHIGTPRYDLLSGGDFGGYIYLVTAEVTQAHILWRDDSRKESEVLVDWLDGDVSYLLKSNRIKRKPE